MESDALLVKRVLAGETEPFRVLVEKYQDAVFGVALSKTGRLADVEEIAQETFLAAFESLPALKDPGSFGNWLYSIARNKVRTHLRAARSRRLAHDRLTEAARQNASGDQHRRDQQHALVRDALRRLSEANREAATLYYINGYSVADIGRFIHRPVGTVKRRLHEARKHLHKELLAMVEGELKQSRPRKKFTDGVVRKITQTRVWLSGGRHNYLLWSDAEGRCFQMFVGEHEARAILTSLAEDKGAKGIDIHAALLATLKGFGYRVREVALSPSTAPNHLVRLKLQRGPQKAKTVEAEYTARDAIQLAVHTRADVVLEGDVAKGGLRRKDGKPMSLAGAVRSIRRRSAHPYRLSLIHI